MKKDKNHLKNDLSQKAASWRMRNLFFAFNTYQFVGIDYTDIGSWNAQQYYINNNASSGHGNGIRKIHGHGDNDTNNKSINDCIDFERSDGNGQYHRWR